MPKKEVLVYLFGTVALLVAVPVIIIYIGYRFNAPFMPPLLVSSIFGAVTSALGLFFTVWANIELKRKGKGGPAVFGKIKLMQETSVLVTTGPYALCRNPMHLGVFLFYLGLCCSVNSLYSLIIPLMFGIFAYCFAVFLDELRLRRDFGAEYEKWAACTPRFLPKNYKK